ncbi:MAG TPA: anthranilate synthase component I family protein [Chitinophagaceae bacterium]|nr:anthranilate synthase component I family protein [Chitinophagaceae bacterium]
MKKIIINTEVKKMLADMYTPVGIYLRMRDRFRDTILLESADNHAVENSYSFICINAIAGIEVKDKNSIEFKLPAQPPQKRRLQETEKLPQLLWEFMQRFDTITEDTKAAAFAQGFYGYFTFDAIELFESIRLRDKGLSETAIPLARYRLYQYVIAINHFKDELILCENKIDGLESDLKVVESILSSKDTPVYPFKTVSEEAQNMTDAAYLEIVKKGIKNCHRGDVFQIVLSRRFHQAFIGDEMNVYRALRNINPSPYLFFFDYGEYKLIGSSPESQLIIKDGKAIVHPIAGTFRRSGNDEMDQQIADQLMKDPKENAEHIMLVDLARNDLSTVCSNVTVSQYRKPHFYSHVIHLVSEVVGAVPANTNPFEVLMRNYPAGTLSGAPKYRAMQLIDEHEPSQRGYYSGTIGFVGFNGSCNHAIMIRTFLSRNNKLFYQAGAGVVAASTPESELNEVDNKLNALRAAIKIAETIS